MKKITLGAAIALVLATTGITSASAAGITGASETIEAQIIQGDATVSIAPATSFEMDLGTITFDGDGNAEPLIVPLILPAVTVTNKTTETASITVSVSSSGPGLDVEDGSTEVIASGLTEVSKGDIVTNVTLDPALYDSEETYELTILAQDTDDVTP